MAQLRVGAGSVDITPLLGGLMSGSMTQRRSEDVGYPLQAKALVFDEGDTQVAYVQNDLLFVTRERFDQAKARAEELTGIPAGNIMMSATHTHYGPPVAHLFMQPVDEEYAQWAVPRMGDAVKLAQNRLQPAVIGHTSGFCPEETHNRRWWMRDGQVRMNPPRGGDELVRPAGPTDPEVGLLVAETPDGEPIAAIANYSLHYVGGGRPGEISADYFAAFAEALQRMAGGEFVAIMANGCCGDTNNIDFTRPAEPPPSPQYHRVRVGNALAAECWKAWRQLRERQAEEVTVAAASEYPIFRRRTLAEEQERVVAGGVNAIEQVHQSRQELYAQERQEVETLPVEQETQVQAMRIGDVGMVGIPGETFVEYGLAIKRSSPFARTMTVELANDYLGYLPTDHALDQGGYETWLAISARAAKGTEETMVQAALRALRSVRE
ncbi:MAG: hypothetical protein U9R79_00230 [Armatimonadota bacterium]|nr:hypothetical protein [Armatimonadota bacterium]